MNIIGNDLLLYIGAPYRTDRLVSGNMRHCVQEGLTPAITNMLYLESAHFSAEHSTYCSICDELILSPLSPGIDVICIKSDTIDDVVVSLVSLEGVRGKFTFRKLLTVIGPEAVVVIGSCLISTENKKFLVQAEQRHSEVWILRPLCCRPTYQGVDVIISQL